MLFKTSARKWLLRAFSDTGNWGDPSALVSQTLSFNDVLAWSGNGTVGCVAACSIVLADWEPDISTFPACTVPSATGILGVSSVGVLGGFMVVDASGWEASNAESLGFELGVVASELAIVMFDGGPLDCSCAPLRKSL
jgi:hypothetical protein